MYALYAFTASVTTFCSTESIMSRSPMGATGTFWTHDTVAGCAPLRIWNARLILISALLPGDVPQFALFGNVFATKQPEVAAPHARESNAALITPVSFAIGKYIGALITFTTPISTPLTAGL